MTPGAQTPEELETLLEDAFVTRDAGAAAALFEPGAVIAHDRAWACGADVEAFVARLWTDDFTYLAQPRRVLQARDTALILADGAISVVHRAADLRWRYAIALLDTHTPQPGGTTP